MKKIYLLAAATLALAACDSNDDNTLASPVAVQVSATIGESTLSRATDNLWSEGDSIGITATVGGVVGPFINVKYTTLDGNEKFTGNPLYFYKPMTLNAYYPFSGTEGTAPSIIEVVTAAENQTAEKQPKIDFLYADHTSVSATAPNVNFTFAHKMSKLTFIFKKGNDGADISKIKSYQIDGLVLRGTFDPTTGVCTLKDGATAETLSIALGETDKKIDADGLLTVPSLIIFPQTIVDKVRLKITDSEEQDYACDLTFDGKPIEPGNNYRYTIKVTKTGLIIEKPTITNWTDQPLDSEAKSDE